MDKNLLKNLGFICAILLAIWGLGEGLAVLVPHMGIDAPLQIAGLIAFIAFTAAIIIVSVRYMLKSKVKIFNDSNPDRLKLIVCMLACLSIVAIMSFLLFNALTYGEASGMGRRDRGKVYPVSQDPGFYWSLVAIYYSIAVAALSSGLALGARLTRNGLTRKTGLQMNDSGVRQKVKLTLELENKFVDSPSAEKLAQALATVGHPGSNSAILSRSEESYIQTAGNLSKGFMIEYREGSDDSHRFSKSRGIPHSEMVKALLAYHRGSEEWKGMFEWNKGMFEWEKGPGDIHDDSPPKRFTGPWRVATIIYFAGAVIVLYGYSDYLYSKGNWGWDMPLLFPLAVVFAPISVSLGLLAIYTGEFQLRGGTFYRSKNPILYWVFVATILSFGIVLFLAVIGVIGT